MAMRTNCLAACLPIVFAKGDAHMKAPKYASRLVNKEDGWMVGVCGRMHILTDNDLWADTFDAYALKHSQHHRNALKWAVEEYGEDNLKWVDLCESD